MPKHDDWYDGLSPADQHAVIAARVRDQQTWRDLQLKRAVERGELGRRPSAEEASDPEWWADKLAELERDAVLRPTLALPQEGPEAEAESVPRVPRVEPAAPPPKRHWWNRRTRGEGDT